MFKSYFEIQKKMKIPEKTIRNEIFKNPNQNNTMAGMNCFAIWICVF